MPLSVPFPILQQDGAIGPIFVAEKPFNLLCGPVSFADGTPLAVENALQFTFLIYRQNLGGTIEAWDEKAGTWVPEIPPPEPQPLFPSDGKWKTILVAIGQKDKASPIGADKFASDPATGFPKYSAKCFFKGRDTAKVEHGGTSARSQSIEILQTGVRDRAGLAITPAPADQAKHISLFVKDAALVERGTILIEQGSGGFVIELKVSGASVKLNEQGGILLTPATGQEVRVTGDLAVAGVVRVNGLALNVP